MLECFLTYRKFQVSVSIKATSLLTELGFRISSKTKLKYYFPIQLVM